LSSSDLQPSSRIGPFVSGQLKSQFSMPTWLAIINLVASSVLGAWFLVAILLGLILSAVFFWVVGVGVALFAATLRLAAGMAAIDRNRIEHLTGRHIAPAELPVTSPGLSLRARQRAWATSLPARRLAVYQLVRPPVVAGAIFAIVTWTWIIVDLFMWATGSRSALLLAWDVHFATLGVFGTLLVLLAGVATILLWPSVVRAGSAVDGALAHRLLGPSAAGELSLEVQRLGEARELALDVAETERRRIERDLHDGIQPRLVSLSIQLGLAKTRIDRDPTAARQLLDQAHDEVKTALHDLRGLVRGIHPSVLDERGLDAALSSLVAGCPIPFRVDVQLGHRPDHTREGIAYFVTAEAINNVTKHSAATSASVFIADANGLLRVMVEDNGRGGAHFEPDGGLAGLRDRVTAVDGELRLISPVGGPTRVEAVIPCAS
jgi:signal transduction histidine kinase